MRAGSLPGLRTGTKPTPSARANGAPKMKPRASIASTTSTGTSRQGAANASNAASKAAAFAKTGVMSLKTMPGRGKSATSRMRRVQSGMRALQVK